MAQGAFNTAFNNKLKIEAPTPKGIKFITGGTQDQMTESLGGLAISLGMGILFIFLVIAAGHTRLRPIIMTTLLTLLFVPVVYIYLYDFKMRFGKKIKKKI